MRDFANKHDIQIWTQSKGPDTVMPFHPLVGEELNYTLPEFGLSYPFNPTEFTQVNPQLNRMMVRRAMELLSPQKGESIADFFCGLGNFTLPIARNGASGAWPGGAASLVERAKQSAELNGLDKQARFNETNLFKMTPESLQALGHFDKWLIDPPRDGAMSLIESLADDGKNSPQRIVYVSCNPATLARDAGLLVHSKNYRMIAAGIINMFPHTTHVESVAYLKI